MKTILTWLTLLLLPAQNAVFMGINYVPPAAPSTSVTYAGQGCNNISTTVSTLSCTVIGVASGNMLLIDTYEYNATVVSVVDSVGTVTHIGGPTNFMAGQGYDDIWYVKNTLSGSHTITITYNQTASYPGVMVNVISGASITSPIDSYSMALQAAYNGTCPSVTTTSANDLLFSFGIGGGGGWSFTAGTVPQIMTTAQSAGSQDTSAYGVAAAVGSNYVEWSGAAGNTFSCDTVAIH